MPKPARVRVATDSIADIPDRLAAELGIAVVPATVIFGNETYREGVDLSREDFYGRMIAYAGLPKTAAPGPGAFAEAFERLIAENRGAGVPLDAIVSLHPPAKLSGLYNSAYAASHMVEGTEIVVIDSGQITMGTGWMTIMAARAAESGASVDQITAMIQQIHDRAELVAGLETLEWAARSGRVNRIIAAIGNLLAVKPIIKIQDGDISLVERVRTHNRQFERVLEIGRSLAPFREVAIMHARAPEVAEALADRLADIHPRERMIVAEIGCALGSYAGPGAYGIVGIRA
jgi:DegV family protein with EDD domain